MLYTVELSLLNAELISRHELDKLLLDLLELFNF